MNNASTQTTPSQPPPAAAIGAKRRRRWLFGTAAFLLVLLVGLKLLLQPERVAGFILSSLGKSLGLDITAAGTSEYRLRGTPQLVVRDVIAREPGAAAPLLHAKRVSVAVPWSTMRSRGETLDFTRIELDAPVVDLPALQHWLATRPPGKTRLPTLSDGLQVTDARIDAEGWRIEDVSLSLPRLQPGQPIAAKTAGNLRAQDMSLRFNLAVAMTRPENGAGLAIAGPVTASAAAWRVPARLKLSAPLTFGGDADLRSPRLRARLDARYESGDTHMPFVLAITSPLLVRQGTLALAPAGVALRGGNAVPNLDAHGALACGRRLLLALDGRMAAWPDAWPALPPPIGASRSPLPVHLRYLGNADLSDTAELQLRRYAARFDARLRLPQMLAWTSDDAASPLPPLSGHLSAPQLEISGAHLEGVEVTFDDAESVPARSTPTETIPSESR